MPGTPAAIERRSAVCGAADSLHRLCNWQMHSVNEHAWTSHESDRICSLVKGPRGVHREIASDKCTGPPIEGRSAVTGP